jgi:hypothetical protein
MAQVQETESKKIKPTTFRPCLPMHQVFLKRKAIEFIALAI